MYSPSFRYLLCWQLLHHLADNADVKMVLCTHDRSFICPRFATG
jgi:hypothetical protein